MLYCFFPSFLSPESGSVYAPEICAHLRKKGLQLKCPEITLVRKENGEKNTHGKSISLLFCQFHMGASFSSIKNLHSNLTVDSFFSAFFFLPANFASETECIRLKSTSGKI